MIGAVATQPPLTPLCASKSGKQQWRPVVAVSSQIIINGGVSARGELATSIPYQVGDTVHEFVELDKNAQWFLKGVGGSTVRKGDLKHVHALAALRAAFMSQAEDYDADANAESADVQLSAVAESQCDSHTPSNDIDPMYAMDDLTDVVMAEASPSPKKKRTAARSLRRSVVLELHVPTRPPCTGDTGGKTAVWVYRHAQDTKRNYGKLYLRVDNIGWLLAYAADELHLQGVTPPARAAVVAGNSSAVAGLRLEYDFSSKSWQGTFIAGHLVGTTKRMYLHDVDAYVWQKLKALSRADGYFSKSRLLERKKAAKEFVTLWCAAALRGEDDEFEQILTTSRGERRGVEFTAVAADTGCYPTAVNAVDRPLSDDEDDDGAMH